MDNVASKVKEFYASKGWLLQDVLKAKRRLAEWRRTQESKQMFRIYQQEPGGSWIVQQSLDVKDGRDFEFLDRCNTYEEAVESIKIEVLKRAHKEKTIELFGDDGNPVQSGFGLWDSRK